MFREFLDLFDADLTFDVVLEHAGSGFALGPVRLGTTRGELEAAGLLEAEYWSYASHHQRQHRLELLVEDEVVVQARYIFQHDLQTERVVLGAEPAKLFPRLTDRLRERLGEPAKRNKRRWRWEQDGAHLVVTEELDSEGWTCTLVTLREAN